jgi:epoxyqueuosine reductase
MRAGCGSCTRCIDACPTDALDEPGVLDATRCLSYWTQVEGEIPEAYRAPLEAQVYGCDICQDVCPWNRKAPRTQLTEFQPRSFAMREEQAQPGSFYLPELLKIANLSPEEYGEAFRGSPIKRTKWRGLLRNACIALGNAAIPPNSVLHQEIVKVLQKLSLSGDVIVTESANWALSRIQSAGQ